MSSKERSPKTGHGLVEQEGRCRLISTTGESGAVNGISYLTHVPAVSVNGFDWEMVLCVVALETTIAGRPADNISLARTKKINEY